MLVNIAAQTRRTPVVWWSDKVIDKRERGESGSSRLLVETIANEGFLFFSSSLRRLFLLLLLQLVLPDVTWLY